MKKNLPYIIGFLLVCGVIFLVFRSCNLYDKNSVLHGQLGEAKNIAEADAKLKDALIAKQNIIIGQANKEIAERDKAIGHLTNTIGHRDADLVTLGGRLAQAKTDTDRVPILTAMVENWRAQYNTATLIIAEKDKVISAWAAKFNAQVTISEAWKAKYDAECRIRHLAEQGWKASESKLRWTRVMGNIKSGAVIAAAGYIIFNAIQGK